MTKRMDVKGDIGGSAGADEVTCRCYDCTRELPEPGFGTCSEEGCGCTGFVDVYGSELCGVCGHHYSAH